MVEPTHLKKYARLFLDLFPQFCGMNRQKHIFETTTQLQCHYLRNSFQIQFKKTTSTFTFCEPASVDASGRCDVPSHGTVPPASMSFPTFLEKAEKTTFPPLESCDSDSGIYPTKIMLYKNGRKGLQDPLIQTMFSYISETFPAHSVVGMGIETRRWFSDD